jgi:glyoxylase-like metal-dependent hydrolase (beta-lactamase superfamily II)
VTAGYLAPRTIDDVVRVDYGYFVRPADETVDGRARVEPVLGYAVRIDGGILLFDTGMAAAPADLQAHYRPTRPMLRTALQRAGVEPSVVTVIVNSHLHFDHCGGNPELPGVSVVVQRPELSAARTLPDYTLPEVIDFSGVAYDEIDGEVEVAPGVVVVPTPGHTVGHQSVVVRCRDGTVILAGQAHDQAVEFTYGQLAVRARMEGQPDPLPPHPDWIPRLLQFDPRRVVFAHDNAVWEPANKPVPE